MRKRRKRAFEIKTVVLDVSRELVARVEANSHRLPGVQVTVVPLRSYPYGSLAAPIFGYARQINGEQYKRMSSKGYLRGDLIGQAGLEKRWEEELRGEHGFQLVEVDARGARRGEVGRKDYRVGKDLFLSLDLDLQEVARKNFEGKRGAVVVMDVRTGRCL